ncbi:Aldo/keto reductase [Artomyces pyxidatus]|uniref:Aldo/keto reductase n=1 Tax=Artomyces pyxidatus TaxID=48021 RepID=A0ACB8T7M9_9AGAM|nr:Aldo/keto reductase [Artomyces pyxidatus]
MVNTPIKLNDGTTIPWLGFGTGTALYGKDAEAIVAAAIKAGLTHLDGAQVYGNEDSLGAGIVLSGKPRSELYVTTKLFKLDAGQTVRETLLESLQKLKVDYVDLFLIHTPTQFKEPGELLSIWKDFEALQKEGLTKSIGVSNFLIPHLTELIEGGSVVPAVNQIEYHPYVFKDLIPLLEFQKKYDIVTVSYGGQSPIFRAKGGPLDPVLADIAKRLSETAGKPYNEGTVLLLWQKAKGIVAVTTTSKEPRLAEYISITDAPDLTPEEVKLIDEKGSLQHHRHFTAFFPSTA